MISVILPTYNEAGNIVDLIVAIHEAVSHPHEILVVDDNSPDGTSRLTQQLIDSGRVPGLRLETRTTDRGLRKSIWRGIELAKGDIVVWMDCDFSMPPAVIPQLLSKVEEGYDIAVGSRFVRGGSQKEHGEGESQIAILLSSVLNVILRVFLHFGFHDYTSGFIAVRRSVFSQIRLKGDYGEYFIDMMFRAILLKHSYIEIPYVCEKRRAGVSKTAPNIRVLLKRGVKYVWVIGVMQGIRLRALCGFRITDPDALRVR
ncbi:polyprenol monophosphomannose synthase [Candidatus Peregrinibacteria bacterium CG10_big_fil_rev_8_21_14_0_10_49_24]|nr:MAG: polyprenol monophosphomannose synthase [Candidatus Peregrinibacteria bacterium CG11_big_fil_rev_8_21_14_0_20_49_14]PIR51468.1 MAG: polyprenol monophosphomannose synthase [Candidatus Peregrinibacteria bacterium CG10_big_fil_rev_8_21_14_0_10_49_24]PJA67889.1 MAG: polyprenol monophosphomannose synthase [Candidatus Peregrinibacteria bacterium CG_4_9_14_3_um_filter_49_12]